MNQHDLDFSATPRREIGDRILSVANALFDAVKSAPLVARTKFPKVLRSNNFALAVRVTNTHAFLEITTKFHAHRRREADRLRAYRQIFTSKDSGQSAILQVDQARLVRVSGGTFEAPHAFALGSDCSMCAWDLKSTTTLNGEKTSYAIDIIYAVGYGENISQEDAWQEFDTLIRVTLSDWSSIR